jgi:hypothetical protein
VIDLSRRHVLQTEKLEELLTILQRPAVLRYLAKLDAGVISKHSLENSRKMLRSDHLPSQVLARRTVLDRLVKAAMNKAENPPEYDKLLNFIVDFIGVYDVSDEEAKENGENSSPTLAFVD